MRRKEEEQVELSDAEMKRLQEYAQLKGISLEEAASVLASRAIERRVCRGRRRRPANNVRQFRKSRNGING